MNKLNETGSQDNLDLNRPWQLYLVLGLLALQAFGFFALIGWFVIQIIAAGYDSLASAAFELILAGIAALWVVTSMVLLGRAKPIGRSTALVLQVLYIAFGANLIAGASGTLLATAIAFLVIGPLTGFLLFTNPVTAYLVPEKSK